MRIRIIVWICLILVIADHNSAGYAQGDSTSRPSNIEQLQKIVRTSIAHIIADGKIESGQRIVVKSPRDENAWLIDQVVFGALASHGVRVAAGVQGDTSNIDGTLEIVPVAIGVRYSPIFHDGLFGESRTERIVQGKFSVSYVVRDRGVRLANVYSETVSDTIPVDKIPALEHPSLRIAKGEPPAGGLLDTLLEPIVIIGAVAIAVYLLFTVRS